ncbi:MAG: TonB-dependent siderophore receptor [Azospirillaceae bacterium]|nr:TonB-dependent siderophore receptor [Azospirillaceae bacterium]
MKQSLRRHLHRVAAVPLIVGAGWAMAPGRALAEEAPSASDPIVLPPVEVTRTEDNAAGPVAGFVAKANRSATKTATDLIETPQAVTVMGQDRLSTQNAQSVASALRYSAGVTDYGSRDDPRGYGGSIRGFAADTYLDGLRLPAAAASQTFDLEPYGLERLEVLRGASSALYGGGSLGGIIDGVSKVPRPDQVNEMSVQTGSFNRAQGTADLGGALNQDGTILWRLNGLARNADTEFRNIKNDRVYVAPSLKWIGEDTTVTLLASYMQIDAGSSSQFLPAVGTVLDNPNGKISRDFLNSDPNYDVYSKQQASVGYEIEHHLAPNWTLRQTLRFAHLDLNYRYVTAVAFLADNRTLTRQALRQSSTYNNLSMDNQSEYKFETGPLTHDILTGVDFSSQFLALRRGQGTAPSIDVFNPVYRPITWPAYANTTNTNQTMLQTGIYAQDQIGFGNWRLTLTGREDFTSSDLANNRTNATTASSPSAFTYRTALLYAFPIGVSPYISYATSFQPQNGTDIQGTPFDPLTGSQVEAGIKFQPTGRDLLLSAAAYDLRQQNVLTPDPSNTSYNVETGEIRSRGVEFEALGSLGKQINFIAALTFQDPRITRSNLADEVGNRPVAIPSQMASLYLDKTWSLDERLSFGFGGGVRYNGDTEGSDPNSFKVPSQMVFDLNSHADFDRWRLQVNGTNVTDRTIYAACTRSVACSYGTGRAVFATLFYRW